MVGPEIDVAGKIQIELLPWAFSEMKTVVLRMDPEITAAGISQRYYIQCY